MDRTSLNLVSIVLGAAGLMTALTGFNVRQTRMAYLSENPYLLKRDAIVNTMTWIFTCVALIGLLIQALAEIAGNWLPERLYTTWSYIRVTVTSVVIAFGLIWVLTRMGKVIARRKWQPLILENSREAVERAAYAFAHNGLFPEHQCVSPKEIEAIRQLDLARIDESLAGLEDLLELEPPLTELGARLRRLQSFYPLSAASNNSIAEQKTGRDS